MVVGFKQSRASAKGGGRGEFRQHKHSARAIEAVDDFCLALLALPHHQKRVACLGNEADDFVGQGRGRGGAAGFHHALAGQGGGGEREERFADGQVEMHGAALRLAAAAQRLVDEAVVAPTLCFVLRFYNIICIGIGLQGMMLRQGLPVHLADPLRRAVGRNHDEGNVPEVRLAHGGQRGKQCTARGDANRRRLARSQSQSQSHEARAALVGHGVGVEQRRGVEIVRQHAVARAWTHHDVLDAVGNEQGGELVGVGFIAVHFYRGYSYYNFYRIY